MKRPIEFRVWDNEEKKYFEPIYEAWAGRLLDLSIDTNGRLLRRTIEFPAEDQSRFEGRYELEQYIGGKGFEDAKNEHFVKGQSKEIKLFEGDIVEAWSEGSKGTFVIKMRTEAQPTFMLYPHGQHGKMWSIAFSDIGRDKFDYYDSLRKIGNVRENPEFVAAQ